ncbi:hypothetical protein [Bacteroides caecimuris]|nr:hypothetical protein [Bacteroides caecimuris]
MLLPPASAVAAPLGKEGVVMLAYMHYDNNVVNLRELGKVAVPILYNSEGMKLLENIESIGFILFNKWNAASQHLFRLTEKPRVVPKPNIPDEYLNIRNRKKPDDIPNEIDYLYLLLDIDMSDELDSSSLDCQRCKLPGGDPSRYDAIYSTIRNLTIV